AVRGILGAGASAHSELLAPEPCELPRRPRKWYAGDLEARDPIGPEMAEVAPELTPCRHQALTLEEHQSHRPDQPVRLRAGDAEIADPQFPSTAARLPDDAQTRPLLGGPAEPRRPEAGLGDPVAQIPRSGGSNLGQCGVGRPRERRITLPLHPADAEHERLELLLVEHQGRQEEPDAKYIPDTSASVDGCAESAESLHVAVDRTRGDCELAGQLCRRYRTASAAQGIHEFEEPGGSAHKVSGPARPHPRSAPAEFTTTTGVHACEARAGHRAGRGERKGGPGSYRGVTALPSSAFQPLLGARALADWTREGGKPDRAPLGYSLRRQWHAHWFELNWRTQLERMPRGELPSDPVLIVGLWRSGTTVL